MNGAPAAGSAGATTAPAAAWRRPSLRVNFGWTFAGNAVNAACAWAILVVVARLADPAAVGRLALASAITVPIFQLCGLQLRTAYTTDAARTFRFADYLGLRMVGTAVACGVVLGVVALGGYERETALVVMAYAVTRAIDGAADIHFAYLHRSERMYPIARSLMLRGVLNLGVVSAVLLAGGGLVLAIFAFSFSSVIVLFAHDARAVAPLLKADGESRRPRLQARTAWPMARVSLPLGLVMLAVSLRTNIPRYFIEHRFGAAELGVYAALGSFVAAGTMVISALGQSAMPRLARHYHDGAVAAFRRLLLRLFGIALVLAAGGVAGAALAGEPLLRLFFGAPYAARADVLVWLMAAGGVAYASSFFGYAVTATRRFTVQLPLFASTSLACAGACALLVPRFALRGAAVAWGLSLVVELVAMAAIVTAALRQRTAQGSPP